MSLEKLNMGRRVWINRNTGLPLTQEEAKGCGHLTTPSGKPGWLVAPCIHTHLKGKIVAYFAFKLFHGVVAVMSTEDTTLYVFLGDNKCSYSVVRGRFKADSQTEELARAKVLWGDRISAEAPVAVLKYFCKHLGEAELIVSFV